MPYKCLIFSVLLLGCTLASGQSALPVNYTKLLNELRVKAANGDKMALRDLGCLIGHPETGDAVRMALELLLFLTEQELDVKKASKSQFLTFFYEHQDAIKYSEMVKGYYLTPLEEQTPDFAFDPHFDRDSLEELILIEIQLQFDSLINGGGGTPLDLLERMINNVVELDLPQSYEYIYRILMKASWENQDTSISSEFKRKIIRGIIRSGDDKSFSVLMEALKTGVVSAEEVVYPLVLLSNTAVEPNVSLADTYTFFNQTINAAGSFNALRMNGLEKIYDFKPSYFEKLTDYFGKVLSRQPGGMIEINTIQDMMMTREPVSLLYLVTSVLMDKATDPFYTTRGLELLERWSGDRIIDPVGSNASRYPVNDPYFKKKMIQYWAANYQNYEWDDFRKRYINKQRAESDKVRYENLFLKLNSDDPDIAISAFSELIQGNPQTLTPLVPRYRKILRHVNPVVPDIKYKWIECLSKLNSFLKNNGCQIFYTAEIQMKVDSLKLDLTPLIRYRLENRLIEMMDINNIHKLEIDACKFTSNVEFSCSVSRVLDYWYSKNYTAIFHHPVQLEIYLKKAALFSQIGTSGIINAYLNKIDRNDSTVMVLVDKLMSRTTDDDIMNLIVQLTAQVKNENSQLTNFFQNPLYYLNHGFINSLPAPDSSDLELMIGYLINEPEPEIREIYLGYWDNYINLSSVPFIMYLLQANIDQMINDRLVKYLNIIYQHEVKEPDPYSYWMMKWETTGANWQDWSRYFYQEDVLSLQTKDTFSIEAINKVLTSPFTSSEGLDEYLKLLSRVRPITDIRKITSRINLNAAKHLQYFDSLTFYSKDLLSLMKLFDNQHEGLLLDFLVKKKELWPIEEQGAFINNMFFVRWFSQMIEGERLNFLMESNLRETLISYLNQSNYISEFEEQNTLLHILQLENFGKSTEDQILTTLQPELEPSTRINAQKAILSKADFDDMRTLMPYNDALNPLYWDVLRTDFGIPVYLLEDFDIDFFTEQMSEWSESDIRLYYLKQIAPEIINSNQELDIDKVLEILSYDLATPFASNGGENRSVLQYTVIKVLESNFRISLGFHPKLNENQTFYTYNPRKRAIAWKKYLIENMGKDKIVVLRPSFNDFQDR